jgi:hypothetical protein
MASPHASANGDETPPMLLSPRGEANKKQRNPIIP